MAGKAPPPLRNYAQMARVVRDEQKSRFAPSAPYQLGKAYGSPAVSGAETRVRTLDEIGINSRPPSQLQAPEADGYYNRRESTTLYHELSDDQQLYFDGVNPNPAPTRMSARPGTKTRAYLNSDATAERINVAVSGGTGGNDLAGDGPAGGHGEPTIRRQGAIHSGIPKSHSKPLAISSSPVDIQPIDVAPAPKQTRLPFVKRASLEGIKGTDLGFNLTF